MKWLIKGVIHCFHNMLIKGAAALNLKLRVVEVCSRVSDVVVRNSENLFFVSQTVDIKHKNQTNMIE